MAEPRKAARSSSSSCTISVRTIPRSSKIAIAPEAPNAYRVKLTASPVEGSANQQLLKLLSEKLSLPLKCIRIISGEHARKKLLKIEGITDETVSRLLR